MKFFSDQVTREKKKYLQITGNIYCDKIKKVKITGNIYCDKIKKVKIYIKKCFDYVFVIGETFVWVSHDFQSEKSTSEIGVKL